MADWGADLADVLAARQRIAPYLRPTPLYRYPALDATGGRAPLGQVREPQAGGCLQGARRGEPAGRSDRTSGGGASSRPRRQSRPVGGLRRAPLRRAGDDLHARAGQPAEGRGDAGDGRRGGLPGPRLRRGPRALRAAGAEHGLRYVHSVERAALVAGVATAALEFLEALPEIDVLFVPVGGGSGVAGAGLVARRSARRSRSSACRPRRPRPSIGPGGRAAGGGHHQHVRRRARHPEPFEFPQRSCGIGWTTSCSSPRTR